MGIIRNIALETAIKKALLDVTNHIEEMTRQESSFGNRVWEYIGYVHASAELEAETWEGSFTRMIAVRAQNEMPSNKLIQHQNDLAIMGLLIGEWVTSKGGDAANVYREINNAFNANVNGELRPTTTEETDNSPVWYSGLIVVFLIILFRSCMR